MPADIPILLMAGSDDAIGGEKGNVLLLNAYKRAGLSDLELIIYDGGRHEVFNETNKSEVMDDLIEWLEARL
jgi:alpha-beta hydrolase superfamily lysophospholipase